MGTTSLKPFRSTNNQIGSHIISFLTHEEDKRVYWLWVTAKLLLCIEVTGVLLIPFAYGVAAR